MSAAGFAGACAFDPVWERALGECMDSLAVPAEANLGFVYFSDRYTDDADALLAALREETGVQHWVGSVGIGVIGSEAAHIGRAGMSMLVGSFPADSFRVFSGRAPLNADRNGEEPYFAVVHGDPHTEDMSELVADMSSKVSSGFITGGLSSARGATVQIADGVLSGGISGVAFNESVSIATRLTQSCEPFADRFEISEAEGNIIGRLDGRLALDCYRETAARCGVHDLRQAASIVLVGLPTHGRDTGDYIVRSVVGIDPRNGLLAINEPVRTGQDLIFVHRTMEAAQRDMRRMLAELSDGLSSPPRAGLYFSCTGRGGAMFGEDASEIALIRSKLGDIPLAGFFANGEISHDRLYGYTGVLTLFL